MTGLSLSHAAQSVGATLLGGDHTLRAVSIDSRTLKAGDVYFALTGSQFDGHDFVANAVAAGAGAVVVERDCGVAVPQLVVRNARQALGQMAAQWLASRDIKKVALTGSNGKTTVKEMLRSVLSLIGPTHATEGNFNNDVGLPLTVFRISPETEFAVLEMGANHAGEIDWLASLVKPDVAVVNNVGPAHLEGFGSLQGVAAAKGEIYEHVLATGVSVVNLDEFAAEDWIARSTAGRTLGFSMKGAGELCGEIVGEGQLDVVENGDRHALKIPLAGEHNLRNALAVVSVCRALGVAWSVIQAGLAAMNAVPGRLVPKTVGGVLILDDSYNANPASTAAGINVLAAHTGGRRWCVLGEMAELGDEAADLHRKVGRHAAQLGIDSFLCIGEHAVDSRRGFGAKGVDYRDQASLIADLVDGLKPGDAVLVKGSLSARMGQVVEAIESALEERTA